MAFSDRGVSGGAALLGNAEAGSDFVSRDDHGAVGARVPPLVRPKP